MQKRFALGIVSLWVLFWGQHFPAAPLRPASTGMYVAPTGNDRNDGTASAPFATIAHAAQVAQPGTTIYIHGGTYRETVVPTRSGTVDAPITFTAVPGETVTISGADPVPGTWQPVSSGPIYAMPFASTFASAINQAEQVFVDGQMLNFARWPATSADPSHPTKSIASDLQNDTGSQATLVDPNLTQPEGYWNGGTIHFSTDANYQDYTGTVIASSPGRLTFRYQDVMGGQHVAQHTHYFLFGIRGAMTAGTWFHDLARQQLYLWLPGGDAPTTHAIRIKRRDYAFDLDQRSSITIKNIAVFGCTITTDDGAGDGKGGVRQGSVAAANHLTLDGITAIYPSYFTDQSAFGYSQWSNNTGIVLSGSNNLLQNSSIAYSAGNGVSVFGQGNRVLNTTIHDVNFMMTEDAGISTGFNNTFNQDIEIGYNTISTSGRALITTRSLQNGPLNAARVHHNVLHTSDLQSADGGAYYVTWNNDGNGLEIDHNLIYDNHDGFGGVGIYIDGSSAHYRIHHNVVWDSGNGITLNGPHNILVYNNTLVPASYAIYLNGTVGSDVELKNNLFTKPLIHEGGATQAKNLLLSVVDAKFVANSANNYQLQAGAPAIGVGIALPGYTDDTRLGSSPVPSGRSPDIGAYQTGGTAWAAGSSTSSTTVAPIGSKSTPTAVPTTTAPPPGTTGAANMPTQGAGVSSRGNTSPWLWMLALGGISGAVGGVWWYRRRRQATVPAAAEGDTSPWGDDDGWGDEPAAGRSPRYEHQRQWE